jgi:hypothetical protein
MDLLKTMGVTHLVTEQEKFHKFFGLQVVRWIKALGVGEQPKSLSRLMVRSAVGGLSWYDL